MGRDVTILDDTSQHHQRSILVYACVTSLYVCVCVSVASRYERVCVNVVCVAMHTRDLQKIHPHKVHRTTRHRLRFTKNIIAIINLDLRTFRMTCASVG